MVYDLTGLYAYPYCTFGLELAVIPALQCHTVLNTRKFWCEKFAELKQASTTLGLAIRPIKFTTCVRSQLPMCAICVQYNHLQCTPRHPPKRPWEHFSQRVLRGAKPFTAAATASARSPLQVIWMATESGLG